MFCFDTSNKQLILPHLLKRLPWLQFLKHSSSVDETRVAVPASTPRLKSESSDSPAPHQHARPLKATSIQQNFRWRRLRMRKRDSLLAAFYIIHFRDSCRRLILTGLNIRLQKVGFMLKNSPDFGYCTLPIYIAHLYSNQLMSLLKLGKFTSTIFFIWMEVYL